MNTKERVYFLLILVLALAALIMQSVALNTAYEPEKLLYGSGVLSTALSFVCFAGALVSLIAALVLKGEGNLPKGGTGVFFFSSLTGLFGIAYFAMASLDRLWNSANAIPAASVQSAVVGSGAFVCAALFGGYFIYGALGGKTNYIASTVLGTGAMLWCIFATLDTYFDMSYAITSPLRLYSMFTTLSLLLFLTCEVRYHAATGRHGRYLGSAFALIFFGLAYSVPMLIYSLVHLSDTVSAGKVDIMLLCVQTSAALYAVARVLSLLDEKNNSEDTEMEYTFKYYEKLEDVNWDDVPKAMVDKYGWGYEYAPLCYARGVYAADTGLVVKMTCHESNPRATLTEFMDDVCNDSCMEFFFAGDDPEDYANLEFNALGTQHTSLRKGEEKGSIDKFTEIPYDEAKIYDDRWELTVILTHKNVQDITGKTLERGATFRGNFYKCGDQCEQLHYGMWSEVGTEKPSFHQPQYFGMFIVE